MATIRAVGDALVCLVNRADLNGTGFQIGQRLPTSLEDPAETMKCGERASVGGLPAGGVVHIDGRVSKAQR